MGSGPSKEEIEEKARVAQKLKHEEEMRKAAEIKLENAKKELELKQKAEAEKELEKKEIELKSKQQDYEFQLKVLDIERNHELRTDFNNKLSSTWEKMVDKDYSASEVGYVSAVISSAYSGTIDSKMFKAIEAKVADNPLEARKRGKEIIKAIDNKIEDIDDSDDDDGISLEVVGEADKV